MTSLRYITNEQFTDGTTIDGSRLEKALQDLEDWINDVPNGHMRNRWLQSQMVFKYLPPTADSDTVLATNTGVAGNVRHYPWLPIYNKQSAINPMRVKGSKLDWNNGYTPGTYGAVPAVEYNDQVVWSMSFAVGDDPIIINGIDALFLTDNEEYICDWLYDSGSPPDPSLAGQHVRDIQFQLTIDNPFLPDEQGKNAILIHRYNFTAQNSILSPQGAGAAFTDMTPALSGVLTHSPQASLSVNEFDIGLPIPPLTRIRFSVIVPIGAAGAAVAKPWYDKPWSKFNPTVTLTVLEQLKDG